MGEAEIFAVKDAVYKIQMELLDGIGEEERLMLAGSLMCRGDYEDVVTERNIVKLCGYPLCGNKLSSEKRRNGRYRVSLKEHKVFDLEEMDKYCSDGCLVNSRAFSISLQEERSSDLNPAKIENVLKKFKGLSLQGESVGTSESGKLGDSELKIQEKSEYNGGSMSMRNLAGPSNAIEGYVPRKDRSSQLGKQKAFKSTQKAKQTSFFDDMNFSSCIITGDEYSVSKMPPSEMDVDHQFTVFESTSHPSKTDVETNKKGSKFGLNQTHIKDRSSQFGEQKASKATQKAKQTSFFDDMNFSSCIITGDEYSVSKMPLSEIDVDHQFTVFESTSHPSKPNVETNKKGSKFGLNQTHIKDKQVVTEAGTGMITGPTKSIEEASADDVSKLCDSMRKSSLKSSCSRKKTHSVTWADEQVDDRGKGNLCKVEELENVDSSEVYDESTASRFASAEALATAINQAAEAVASGEADVTDAVSEAGIIILPPDHDECEAVVDNGMVELDTAAIKWPKKREISDAEILESADSWLDTPPDGFSLELSPFATMYMSIFAWTTSSYVAYIYGQDESSFEEYSSIDGKEYPQKRTLSDGRSSEIKQALAGSLSRALPGLVAELRMHVPVSHMEKELSRLLETMTFVDALPSLRMKQWQLITLLLLDALSVCRIPALQPIMTSQRILLHKVFENTNIGAEEYEAMKDHMIPLGRTPQFSAQCGA